MKVNKIPDVAAFLITSRCNNNCKHCFSRRGVKELETKQLEKVFRILNRIGVRRILLSGGEPLVREDFDNIILFLKSLKFTIYLDTNCDFFLKHEQIISNNVTTLGVSIDFTDCSYRNTDNLNKVLEVLSLYKDKKNRPRIKVCTVVTKDNIKKLERIGKLLSNYDIDIWKVCQFILQGENAVKNRNSLEVTDSEFKKTTNKLISKYNKYFKTVIAPKLSRSKAYFMIQPNGLVIVPTQNGEIFSDIVIGSVFDEDVVKKWGNIISYKKYSKNILATF